MSPSSTPSNRTALVFGASGITGWAVVREALSYPSDTTFQRVIALFNRPMDPSRLFLPKNDKATFAHGIDLTKTVDDVAAVLSSIDGIQDVTDVYFACNLASATA